MTYDMHSVYYFVFVMCCTNWWRWRRPAGPPGGVRTHNVTPRAPCCVMCAPWAHTRLCMSCICVHALRELCVLCMCSSQMSYLYEHHVRFIYIHTHTLELYIYTHIYFIYTHTYTLYIYTHTYSGIFPEFSLQDHARTHAHSHYIYIYNP